MGIYADDSRSMRRWESQKSENDNNICFCRSSCRMIGICYSLCNYTITTRLTHSYEKNTSLSHRCLAPSSSIYAQHLSMRSWLLTWSKVKYPQWIKQEPRRYSLDCPRDSPQMSYSYHYCWYGSLYSLQSPDRRRRWNSYETSMEIPHI